MVIVMCVGGNRHKKWVGWNIDEIIIVNLYNIIVLGSVVSVSEDLASSECSII